MIMKYSLPKRSYETPSDYISLNAFIRFSYSSFLRSEINLSDLAWSAITLYMFL